MSAMTIQVQRRDMLGKNESRRLRAAGKLPAVVYGGGKEPLSITVDRKMLGDHYRTGAHANSIFLLKLEGTEQQRHVMIRDVERHPVTRDLLHVDFVRVEMDHKVRVQVPIVVDNHDLCAGVKLGGLLDFATREVEIECLPGDIPASIHIDATPLEIGDHIRLGEIGIEDAKHRVLGDHDRVVVAVVAPAKAEAEGEAAEGEAAAAAEPEVIKKGKKEEPEA